MGNHSVRSQQSCSPSEPRTAYILGVRAARVWFKYCVRSGTYHARHVQAVGCAGWAFKICPHSVLAGSWCSTS